MKNYSTKFGACTPVGMVPIRISMVLFRCIAVMQGGTAGEFFKKLVEMGGIGKVQLVRNLGHGKCGVPEQGAGFQKDHFIDVAVGRFAG